MFFEQHNACGVHVNADNLVFYQKHENEESALFLSQKYLKSMTLSVNPVAFVEQLPEWLRRMQFESGMLETLFLDDEPFVAQSPNEVSMLFKQLLWVPEMYREAYLPIKTQELLWMLTQVQLDKKTKCDPCDNVELAKEMEKFLTDHIETYFSIEALSQRYQMAPATLQKAFKAVYGTTIGDYMQTYRLSRAKCVLLITKKSIKDIAIMCGFESTSVFSASFKKQTGLSPTDYREQYGENYKTY